MYLRQKFTFLVGLVVGKLEALKGLKGLISKYFMIEFIKGGQAHMFGIENWLLNFEALSLFWVLSWSWTPYISTPQLDFEEALEASNPIVVWDCCSLLLLLSFFQCFEHQPHQDSALQKRVLTSKFLCVSHGSSLLIFIGFLEIFLLNKY